MHDRPAPQVPRLGPAAEAGHDIHAPRSLHAPPVFDRRIADRRKPLRQAADFAADGLPGLVVPVPPAGEHSHGGVGVFMPGRVPEGLLLLPQKVRKADLPRSVFHKCTHAVLPCHAPGKGHGYKARIDPKQAVEPPVFRLHLCKRPHMHPPFLRQRSCGGRVFSSFLLPQKPVY